VIESIGEYEFKRCALSNIDRSIYDWIFAYNLYCKGVLPTNNGWLKQSNKYLDVMIFIENVLNKHQQEQRKHG